MYRIKTLNKISPAGLSVLDQTRYTISTDVENEDGILVRSADMHDYAFPDALRAVARAGAGTNNIPIDRCSEAGIVVFNTPGANASITGVLSKDGVNVANMTNKSKKDYAYTVVDVDSRIGESVADTIRALDVVLRVRLLNH